MNPFTLALLIILGAGFLYVLALFFGRILIKKGQKHFDEVALLADGGTFAENKNGRKIAYFTYGNMKEGAPSSVVVHGSGLEAMFEASTHRNICEKLDIKGIAISLPGAGYTDMNIGRTISKWPEQDLEPVLEKEKVKDFFIIGHSHGTSHAAAAAFYFKDKCKGLGLNAPFLPNSITRELKIPGALGWDSLPSTKELQKPSKSWYFLLFYVATNLFSPWLPLAYIFKVTPKIKEDDELVERIKKSLRRSVVRGSIGSIWESSSDVCYNWGFDPRLIETKNICIWHAKDDAECPPEIGSLLADHYREKNAYVDFRNATEGFGHFTYCRGEFLDPEKSMVSVLLKNKNIHKNTLTK